ncbi:ABC transporter permease [Terrisporobacter vanillatitrophus]|uniref:ABC transporter permease n=1 Tax=Terrisporobacter vanillatitrophus TaxID=3058402 RepID=UPI0033672D18
MLGKLIKYEFKACGRIFFPLYLGILLLAVINGVYIGVNFKNEVIDGLPRNLTAYNTQGILMLVLVALFVALFVITIVLTIQRFKKNLLDEEGYLMFTLPVKSSSLILSKLLVALIYVIISAIVASLSFIIIGVIAGDINIVEFLKVFTNAQFLTEGIQFTVYMLLGLLISYGIFVLIIYLSLSIGQLPQLSKHRVAAGVILFFIINLIITNLQNFVRNNILGSVTEVEITSSLTGSYLTYVSLELIIGVVLFLLTSWILNKKLNLE